MSKLDLIMIKMSKLKKIKILYIYIIAKDKIEKGFNKKKGIN